MLNSAGVARWLLCSVCLRNRTHMLVAAGADMLGSPSLCFAASADAVSAAAVEECVNTL